jgi:hypothetical protein
MPPYGVVLMYTLRILCVPQLISKSSTLDDWTGPHDSAGMTIPHGEPSRTRWRLLLACRPALFASHPDRLKVRHASCTLGRWSGARVTTMLSQYFVCMYIHTMIRTYLCIFVCTSYIHANSSAAVTSQHQVQVGNWSEKLDGVRTRIGVVGGGLGFGR